MHGEIVEYEYDYEHRKAWLIFAEHEHDQSFLGELRSMDLLLITEFYRHGLKPNVIKHELYEKVNTDAFPND